MQQQDTLQRFIFEDSDIRGEIVHLDQSFQTIMQQHQYPQQIKHILGETLVAAVLLSATLKYKGQLTIQFQSDNAIKLLVAKCNEKFEIRGLAQFELTSEQENKQDDFPLAGGQLVVTIEQDDSVQPYQSIIPLTRKSIAENLEDYFGQSVQVATKISLAVSDNHAAGMLLQLLPSEERSALDREQFWEYATHLSATLTPEEMLNLDNQTILHRLFHEDDIRIYEPDSIQFKCRCSYERMENVLMMLGKKEVDSILEEKQVIDITCEYCNLTYTFDRIDVAKIFHSQNST